MPSRARRADPYLRGDKLEHGTALGGYGRGGGRAGPRISARAEALLVLDYARHVVVEFLDNSSEVSDNVQLSLPTIETRSTGTARIAVAGSIAGTGAIRRSAG